MFIVIDLKRGGLDGFYSNQKDADAAKYYWRERLGHDAVIVAQQLDDDEKEISDQCFIANMQTD